MLDEINSELLSIYPGLFPKSSVSTKKHQVFNSGFELYIRPPFPLYNVECKFEPVPDKRKKAEKDIRKLYKMPASTKIGNQIDGVGLFEHNLSTDATLAKYREAQMYTKSRLRKVNKKQLNKAIKMFRGKEEDGVTKVVDTLNPQVDGHVRITRPNLSKHKESGGTRLESTLKRNNMLTLTALYEPAEPQSTAPPNSADTGDSKKDEDEDEVESPIKRLFNGRVEVAQKLGDCHVRGIVRSGSRKCQTPSSSEGVRYKADQREAPLREMKHEILTKIVTFKKKAMLNADGKPISILYRKPTRSGPDRRHPPDEINNIDHIYKINENNCFRTAEGSNTSTRERKIFSRGKPKESADQQLVRSPRNQMLSFLEEFKNFETHEKLPSLVLRNEAKRQSYLYRQDRPPGPFSPVESQIRTLPPIQSAKRLKKIEPTIVPALKKVAKKEQRYMSLPKITPSFDVAEPSARSNQPKAFRAKRSAFLNRYSQGYTE